MATATRRAVSLESINLQPQEPILAARALDSLIQKWLDWCLEDLGEPDADGALRSYTVAGYASKIAHFRLWWAEVGPPKQWELCERDFLEFNRWLTVQSGLSYNSRKDVLRRLGQMFKWSFKRNYLQRDYSIWLPEADGSAPLRVAAPLEALQKLMEAAAQSDEPARNTAIVAIAIGTGARRAEICMINVEDVSFLPDCSGSIRIHHAKKVRGREVRGRLVIFDSYTGQHIRRWIDALWRERGPLFPGIWRHKAMQPSSMGRIVDDLITTAGLKGQIQNLHDIRRSFITLNRRHRRGGAYDKSLQRQVGHASAVMTNHYDLSDIEAIRADIVSPFALMADQPTDTEHNTGGRNEHLR